MRQGNGVFLYSDDGQKVYGVKNPDGSLVEFQSMEDFNDTAKRSITAVGTYTGNGTSVSVSCGFEPDLVIVKGLVAQQAIYVHRGSWYRRSDSFIAADSTGGGITITANGFSVGAAVEANTNTITYYYFAYKDNGSKSFRGASWHGNAINGRDVNIFDDMLTKSAIIKRDSAQQGQYVFVTESSSYSVVGIANSNAAIVGGRLKLSSDATVNQWSSNLGEGCNGLVFGGKDTYAGIYTGTGAVQRIPIPFEPDFLLIQPLANTGQNAHIWFSNLAADQVLAVAPSASILTSRLTSVGSSDFALPNTTQLNNSGTKYAVFAFRKNRATLQYKNLLEPTIARSIQLQTGGYIDCGTSDSLKFDGACTIEWFGAIYPPSTTPFAGGAGVNDEANKQIPLIFRSSGADATDGNCSFGLAALCPRPEGTGQRGGDWDGVSISWATFNKWELPQTSSPVLDNFPAFSGVLLDSGKLTHLILTHDGHGGWTLFVDGLPVKEIKRTISSGIKGGSGHRTVIGARRRASSIDYAYGQQFKLARIYTKQLTIAEAEQNYKAAYGKAVPVPGELEEWSANRANGSTVYAKNNSENNGTIVSGALSNPQTGA